MLPVVILAGGLATRLRPYTETVPKAMITIAGEPFISHQLIYLKKQGITNVIMCLGYLGNEIRNYVESKDGFGLKISYSHDGDELVGTGGAIKKALPLLTDIFFVLYGDSYLPINYETIEKFFFSKNYSALMTVFENNGKFDKSNVRFSNDIVLEYDKKISKSEMRHIDYGLGVLRKSLFDDRPTKFDLTEIYSSLAAKNKLAGFEVFERFYEIGSFNGIKDTNIFLTGN
ncbi:sugar phosphate nucleotidyltransferase [Polynucleobacter sp. MG-6-Vaara-E2]|uniref:sugar phosphate nucleotidyltransferase n=1 Tax=Polynucleobacter sp. MG-6-Vaara-E2 TaxID=2576932 RepID=UPI001BFD78AB|nr:sugar phosphate nucleotidyltransferase [Polynucleobacter sp. MG-6-Vaara-E2]QWD96925.1 NTP transferase domain-containing protein [Polynucleobacter sp. MG-6-Vaara-E2]